jgi:hypothetical protein
MRENIVARLGVLVTAIVLLEGCFDGVAPNCQDVGPPQEVVRSVTRPGNEGDFDSCQQGSCDSICMRLAPGLTPDANTVVASIDVCMLVPDDAGSADTLNVRIVYRTRPFCGN